MLSHAHIAIMKLKIGNERKDCMKSNYKKTMYACFTGYIVQAIVNNFVPLLFVTFQKNYKIPLSEITVLITVNFMVQLLVDLLSAGFIDRIGYRASIILAHIFSAAGLVLLTVLPELFGNAFWGIAVSVIIYALGGGLIEVLISPIMEACPTDNKEKAMSLLHSFYCWGHMGVVLLSTAFFAIFGIENWKILTLLWVLIPVANIFLFAGAPICSLNEEEEKGLTAKELFSQKIFWIFMLMMMCAGASEQAVSQWASTFAEQGLGLTGCAVCGFSVGILWPGTFSKASASVQGGGTLMFAMLALAGDLGCSGGPTLAGFVADSLNNNLRMGILSAVVFPVLLLAGVVWSMSLKNKTKGETYR